MNHSTPAMKITGRIYSRLLRIPAHCEGGLTSILTFSEESCCGRYTQADQLIHQRGRGLFVRVGFFARLVDDVDRVVALDNDPRHGAALNGIRYFIDRQRLLGGAILSETHVQHCADRNEQQEVDNERLGTIRIHGFLQKSCGKDYTNLAALRIAQRNYLYDSLINYTCSARRQKVRLAAA